MVTKKNELGTGKSGKAMQQNAFTKFRHIVHLDTSFF